MFPHLSLSLSSSLLVRARLINRRPRLYYARPRAPNTGIEAGSPKMQPRRGGGGGRRKSRRHCTPQNIPSDEWWYPTLTRYGLRLSPSVCRTVTKKSHRNDGWALARRVREASKAAGTEKTGLPPLFSYACVRSPVEKQWERSFSARSCARKTVETNRLTDVYEIAYYIRHRLTVSSNWIVNHDDSVSCDSMKKREKGLTSPHPTMNLDEREERDSGPFDSIRETLEWANLKSGKVGRGIA